MSPQERWPAGRDPANHRQPKAPQIEAARIKALDPGLRRGDESLPTALPATKALHEPTGNGEAEPAVVFPFWKRRAARVRRGIVASMSEPVRAVSTRPAGRGWSEGTGASGAAAGALFGDFSSPPRKSLARRGETRQSPPTEGTHQDRSSKDQGTGPRPAPGRRIVPESCARNEGTAAERQWRSRAGSSLPFCSAECSPRPAGIVASMFEPARASFDATRRPWVERGHRREPALRQGRFFIHLLVATRKRVARRARPGQSPPAESPPPSKR